MDYADVAKLYERFAVEHEEMATLLATFSNQTEWQVEMKRQIALSVYHRRKARELRERPKGKSASA